MALTEGHLLGGRVRYAQSRDGFRSGIEPVLLAAAIPARRGERVLEGGSGAGATLLCLVARVGGLAAVGIEHDRALAEIAADNARANDFRDLHYVVGEIGAGDIGTGDTGSGDIGSGDIGAGDIGSRGLGGNIAGPFDHACANPPYHAPDGTQSPNHARENAKRGADGLLAGWATALGRRLRPRGTLTFILPAALLPECLDALETARCRPSAVLPLWPKPQCECKLILVQGIKGGRAPMRLLPGLVLHRPDGGFTAEAEAILRDGAALSLA
jgi:tRNA1Val (adenine37-N6)-methyltransferase